MSAAPAMPLIASQREAAAGWPPLLASVAEPAARQRRLDALAAIAWPGGRAEAWKYTSLRALGQRRFALVDVDEAAALAVDPGLLAGLHGPALVFVNGVFRADLSARSALPEGLSLHPLSEAGADALMVDASALPMNEPFERLNAALAVEGVLLRVAAGCRCPQPVRLVFVGAPASQQTAAHLRLSIELEADAELSVLEQHLATDVHANLLTVDLDVAVGRRARLHYQLLQQAADTASLFRHSRFQLAEAAAVGLHVLELGGGLVRHGLEAQLDGAAARFDSHGVFIVNGRRHVDTQLQIRHGAKDTVSRAVWRGVADERGRGVFRGAIVVAAGADGGDASLSNKNLLLSAQAEIDSKPELEIYADEVKAAHGATIGQLDPRSLFYLQSRGIPRTQARTMLIAAFCRELLQSVPDLELHEFLDQRLLQHLPHLD